MRCRSETNAGACVDSLSQSRSMVLPVFPFPCRHSLVVKARDVSHRTTHPPRDSFPQLLLICLRQLRLNLFLTVQLSQGDGSEQISLFARPHSNAATTGVLQASRLTSMYALNILIRM